jgi:hypothetical protein
MAKFRSPKFEPLTFGSCEMLVKIPTIKEWAPIKAGLSADSESGTLDFLVAFAYDPETKGPMFEDVDDASASVSIGDVQPLVSAMCKAMGAFEEKKS